MEACWIGRFGEGEPFLLVVEADEVTGLAAWRGEARRCSYSTSIQTLNLLRNAQSRSGKVDGESLLFRRQLSTEQC